MKNDITNSLLRNSNPACCKFTKLCKKFLGVVFTISVLTLVSSCNTLIYQVYEVKTDGLDQRDNALIYENNDCKISYNLWSQDGNIGFIFYNKSDKDIYVNKKETFFIKNGMANNYFKSREYSSNVSSAYSASNSYFPLTTLSSLMYAVPTDVTTSKKLIISRTITEKEEALECVPPHSWKLIQEYNVSPDLVLTCNSKTDCPSSFVEVKSYTSDDSPVKFSNRIAYSFDPKGTNSQFINNNFYISSIKNYSKKSATEDLKVEKDCLNSNSSRKVFKIGGPDKFYKTFKYKGAGLGYSTKDYDLK